MSYPSQLHTNFPISSASPGGTDSQQKQKIAESKVGRMNFIGKERVVVDQAQPTRKRGSPKQGPFLRPSRSPWSCAAFDVQNRNEQDRGMPAESETFFLFVRQAGRVKVKFREKHFCCSGLQVHGTRLGLEKTDSVRAR